MGKDENTGSDGEAASTSTVALAAVQSAMAANVVLGLLSDEARRRLCRAGSPLTLASGALLCQRGDAGDAVFIVLEGEVEARSASAEGREVVFARFGKTSVVGEMAALDGGPRSTDLVAACRSRLWRIPRNALTMALESEPRACVALVAELARRLRATNTALEGLRTLDLGGRLAGFLLTAGGDRKPLALTQTEIARRVGASREKVNSKLGEWKRLGLVSLSSAGVRVLESETLADFADPTHVRASK